VPYLFGFRPGMDILGDVEAGFTIFRISWRISTIFSMGLHELPTYLKSFRQAHAQVDDLETDSAMTPNRSDWAIVKEARQPSPAAIANAISV
jgi:hypothetical protein